jgi:hypothetical protein
MSQFASTPGILPGRSLSYMPKTQQEAQCYETLWTAVNPSGAPTITGAQAVPFFQRSGLEITVLKNVRPFAVLLDCCGVLKACVAVCRM